MKKLISIVTPCYNEEGNIELFCNKIKEIFSLIKKYDYELIVIDNCSTDKTAVILKELAKKDKKLKVILNSRNFGHIRSPHHALLQAKGDAVIPLAADFQDTPELIPEFLKQWETGYKTVIAVKNKSEESALFFTVRKFYYRLVNRLSDIELIENATGFGLYDKKVIEILREIHDPYPYIRGLVCEIGLDIKKVYYSQPTRKRGFTKNNFYTLYDMAMLGITSHSKVPLRLATFFGFISSFVSFVIGLVYLILKLLFWQRFSLGTAPLLIGLFFSFSINLFFLGLLGEYMLLIQTQVLKRPLVIEKERINFEEKEENKRKTKK